MLPSARTRPLRVLSERLLITKIITGLGLALLLIVAAWSASHSEADGTLSSAGASVAVSQIVSDAVAGDAAVVPNADQDLVAVTEWADVGTVLAGTAGCLLGIFCTILLIALIRYFVLPRTAPRLGGIARTLSILISADRPVLRPVTLSELSISRT
ncbi:hypothetical protein GCM10009775_33250 [Microbacterium aoyamense]|uniref:Uncharacterized protein n=1 Tax=Microbacterium aoyamense TaxID=344166 RepID=A0ABN2PYQ5_9MICO|nr:hypothetical protein [Microbacterium aoyamense]